jgi:hypothetical protein
MSRLILVASAALLVLAPPALAQGHGDKGGGKGGGGHAQQGGKPDRGGGRGQRPEAERGRERNDAGRAAVRREPRQEAHGNDRRMEMGRGKPDAARERNDRSDLRAAARQRPDRSPPTSVAERRADLRSERRADVRPDRIRDDVRPERIRAEADRVRVIERGRYVRPTRLLNGCPPGLARKGNGCLPPGQARKLIPNTTSSLYRYSSWYDDAVRDNWGYWNGYAYRVDPVTHLVAATVPLLGGALYRDAVWPQVYADYTPDPYYVRYFGYDDDYEYRYADGALFAVRPNNYEIEAVAALLAGDPWAVGRPVPIGYSVYNVPPSYRDRYYDGPEAWYRYSDGYVYRIDPSTQLVLAAIALLA